MKFEGNPCVKLAPGDIAVCGAGRVGLITEVKSRVDVYEHIGIHLDPDIIGQPWHSVVPKKIGSIHTYMAGVFADGAVVVDSPLLTVPALTGDSHS